MLTNSPFPGLSHTVDCLHLAYYTIVAAQLAKLVPTSFIY